MSTHSDVINARLNVTVGRRHWQTRVSLSKRTGRDHVQLTLGLEQSATEKECLVVWMCVYTLTDSSV